MSGDGSIIGKRVRLSLLGVEKKIIVRGSRFGRIKGVRMNGEPTQLLVKRDGVKVACWYDARFWTIVGETKE